MVPKPSTTRYRLPDCFRAVLFRMVPKHTDKSKDNSVRFRAVLFRMVPKLQPQTNDTKFGFRAVLFRMVPKHGTI